MNLYIVGCSKSKAGKKCKAKDLYTGQLFVAAKNFLEAKGETWRIVSARYGLLDPESEVSPYDKTIDSMNFWEKVRWGDHCRDCIQRVGPSKVIILASKEYASWLIGRPGNPAGEPNKHMIKDWPFLSCVEFPLLGLGIGMQKKYLKGLSNELSSNKDCG